jgi:hypothetical protein
MAIIKYDWGGTILISVLTSLQTASAADMHLAQRFLLEEQPMNIQIYSKFNSFRN